MRHLMRHLFVGLALVATPSLAGTTLQLPGAVDATRIAAGTYKADTAHTQVGWQANHFGFNPYRGLFGGTTATLNLDPAKPAAASLSVTIPLDKVVTTSDALTKHLLTADFFDAAKFPTAQFVSTKIDVTGNTARITGNLTLHGVTKPVTLDAQFVGAGINPMNKAATVGFEASAIIKRSDFGIAKLVPLVSDEVGIRITSAFELQK